MLMDVEAWLKSPRNYADGVKIFSRHNKNNVLLKMLHKGETAFNREKLIKSMMEIASADAALGNVFNDAQPPQRTAGEGIISVTDYKRADNDIRDLNDKIKQQYKENARLHSELALLVRNAHASAQPFVKDMVKYENAINNYLTQNEAGDIANRLLDADDVLDALYKKIDYWKVHGKLPEEKAAEKTEMGKYELQKRINNLRSLISKCKKKEMRQSEIPALEQEKKHLEILLNGLI